MTVNRKKARRLRKLDRKKAASSQNNPNANETITNITTPAANNIAPPNNSEECSRQSDRTDRKSNGILPKIDIFVGIGIVVQVVTLLVVFFQLRAYQKSNDLISNQFVISKIPFLGIEDLQISELRKDKSFVFVFKVTNDGDNAAIIKSYDFYWIDNQGITYPAKSQSDISNDWITPHKFRPRIITIPPQQDSEMTYANLMNGTFGFAIKIESQSIFHDNFSYTYKYRFHSTSGTFSIEDIDVEGLPSKP